MSGFQILTILSQNMKNISCPLVWYLQGEWAKLQNWISYVYVWIIACNEDIIIRFSVINVEFGFFHRKCCFCYTLFLFTFAKIPWISIICFLCMLKTCVYADMDMGRPVRLLRFAFSLFLCIKSLLFLLQLDSTWYENVVVKENGKGKSNLFLGCSPYRMTLKRWTRVK